MSQQILRNPVTGKTEKAEVFRSSGVVASILFGDGTEVTIPSEIDKVLATKAPKGQRRSPIHHSFRELANAFRRDDYDTSQE